MQFRPYKAVQFLSILFIVVLAGCSSVPLSTPSKAPATSSTSRSSTHPVLPPAGSGRGGYYKDDGPGEDIPDGLENLPDAEPRVEPYAKRGNKPYVVFGKQYVPIVNDEPFKQRGRGSWYGKKFHGQKTSSGEPYDMYQMSAAHPTLPIPSYARVTNLSNGKQVIVRVNDRGPFHSSRVIDLSYTAALKLGYIGHGSAELEVERLLPAEIERINANKGNEPVAVTTPAPSPVHIPTVETTSLEPIALQTQAAPADTQVVAALSKGFYLQFGAYSQVANAEAVRVRLAQEVGKNLPQLKVEPSNNLYRLYSGPFASRDEAAAAAAQVQQAGVNKPLIFQR
ncbi:septal ring lytic transglycosylase RlpA family protein [Herminiimonas arsenitoxidans]|uniref:septal ring lytic transglycosylase RlpA family protein n=1 Tax=Herminiimonas arsenitoxidans TaxID=1809410 RepID=UPI0009702531|nr:septal ring lytic transglycosylase RlpA family protein [Herminiimonas arsenitoxidans]